MASPNTFTPEELAALKRLGHRRRFRKGTTLFRDGDQSDSVLLIESGHVKLCHIDMEGREHVIAVLDPGEMVGELSAVDGLPRSATAMAVEAVDAVVISADAFNQFVETQPRAAAALLRVITRRLRDADRARIEFGTHDTFGRVASRLVELAERFGEESDGAVRITLPITQDELAGWTGSSREAVVKALRSMRSRGWIETARRQIVVLDLAALANRPE